MNMVHKHVLLYNHQDRFLRSLGDNYSEHIRKAVDDYEQKIKNQNATMSASKRIKILRGGVEVSNE